MTLPNSEATRDNRSFQKEPEKRFITASGNVLVVDDEAGVSLLCKRILERSGMRVTSTTTAQEGLNFLEHNMVDLMLVDFRMPAMDGFQLMDLAHRQHPDLAVVVMTGYGTLETAIEALQRGADGLILKPFTGKELVESVKHALEQSYHKQDVLRLQALRPLFDVSERLFSETNPQRLGDLLLEAVCGHLQCAYAVLRDDKGNRREDELDLDQENQVHRIRYGGRGETQALRIESIGSEELSNGTLLKIITGWAGKRDTPLLIDVEGLQNKAGELHESRPSEESDSLLLTENELELREAMVKAGVGSILVAPLIYGADNHQAMLFAFRLINDPSFRESDLEMLLILARQAGVALENARLHTELRAYIRQVEASQRALVQAEKMAIAGRLTASIAHEINNPLQSVHNCLHLAGRKELAASKREAYRKLAQEELERLMQTVQRMLEYYRPGAVDRKPTDLNATLRKVLSLMGKQIVDSQVKVSLQLDESLPLALVVEDQIQQVFINLVLNALEAMQAGGELFIESRLSKAGPAKVPATSDLSEDHVSFLFCDTGPGIPPSRRRHVFEPFVSTKKNGTGLGLAVSYGIITAHGGTLELIDTESAGLQFGTSSLLSGACFCITLPVSQVG